MNVAIGCAPLALLAGCDPSLTVSLGTFQGEPSDRPVPTVAPEVYIDGVPSVLLEIEYPSVDAAIRASHVMELRYGDQIVRSIEIVLSKASCLGQVEDPDRYSISYCVYESGDLRTSSDRADSRSSSCIGDAFCKQECTCADTEHCTSRVMSSEPFASHLACAPLGTRKRGESCSLIAGEERGAYDDCGRDLLCVEGACRALCVLGRPQVSCDACAYVPGHAPELQVCVPGM